MLHSFLGTTYRNVELAHDSSDPNSVREFHLILYRDIGPWI